MGSQEGFWNGIPSRIPCGIGRIPGGILTLQTFSIYVWFTAGSQDGSQVRSREGCQMGSQVGFWNGIPSGIPGGIGRILGGILTLQTFSIYVWFTAGAQVGLESHLGSRVGSQKQALARISKMVSQVKSRVVFAGYKLLSQICKSVLCERPGT